MWKFPLIGSGFTRRIGARCTWAVVLLQAAVLLTLAVTPSWSPPRVRFFEMLWAWMHRPSFYPLVALLSAGPGLTVIAMRIRGWHRLWVLAAWAGFLTCVTMWYSRRVLLMLRVLWWQAGL